LDPKPWGSRGLERYGFPLPPDTPIGEAVITSHDALTRAAAAPGMQLGHVMAADPVSLGGSRGRSATGSRPLFPLLVKLIDAAENLSIQVHPDDEAAKCMSQLGKTEAWHILSAAPGAVLYIGLQENVSVSRFIALCRDGVATAGCLRRIPAVVGTTVLIPAGTVHAIGAGVLVYEVQQPSNLTYRLDDWGRVDAAGRPRELHIDAAQAVIDAESRPDLIPPIPMTDNGDRHLLAACRYFALERLVLGTGEEAVLELAAPESPQVLTCLQGDIWATVGKSNISFSKGDSVVIPAVCAGVRVRAAVPSVLLRTWVPDLEHEVVGPARAMGAPDDAIAALAGETGHLENEL
jgi:mannose-6-phosphate isomerase